MEVTSKPQSYIYYHIDELAMEGSRLMGPLEEDLFEQQCEKILKTFPLMICVVDIPGRQNIYTNRQIARELVMAFYWRRGPDTQPFAVEEVRLLSAIGDMPGNALRRQRLFEEAQRHLEQLQALRNINMAITGSLDLHIPFKVVLDVATRLLKTDAVAILRLGVAGIPRGPGRTGGYLYRQRQFFHKPERSNVELIQA